MRLALILLTLPLGAQTGISLRESSPEIYRQLKEQIQESPPALSTAKQVAIQSAVTHRDSALLDKKLSVLTSQIMAISTEMSKVKLLLADKDMSRVSLLEERAAAIQKAKEVADAEQKANYQAILGWIKPICLAVFAAMLSNFTNLYLSRKRSRAHTAEVKSVQSSIDTLKDHTNGMTQRLEGLAELKGKTEGKAEGIRETDATNRIIAALLVQEKLDAENKKLGLERL